MLLIKRDLGYFSYYSKVSNSWYALGSYTLLEYMHSIVHPVGNLRFVINRILRSRWQNRVVLKQMCVLVFTKVLWILALFSYPNRMRLSQKGWLQIVSALSVCSGSFAPRETLNQYEDFEPILSQEAGQHQLQLEQDGAKKQTTSTPYIWRHDSVIARF